MIALLEDQFSKPLNMPWRDCIAVGRAYELLRKDLLEHLRIVQRELGFRYCRFHGIFHDDISVVAAGGDDTVLYQWHHVDKVYDSLLELNLRPFVELNPMPRALASGTQTIFEWRMNVTPPKSYEQWADLIRSFAQHLIDRYGREEVRRWYFEVWNEPNLPGFWSGTQSDYWKLYDTSALALKQVDKLLRVGGPATSKAKWISELIQHCKECDVPLDFISTHVYPQDEYVEYPDRNGSPHAVGAFFSDTIRGVQDTVRRSSKPDLPIHWTEWNTMSARSSAEITWTENEYVDSAFGASFVVANCIALDDACQSMTYWTASDIFEESGMPHRPFSSGHGLLTIHGIPKPAFNAFKLLNKMRGSVMEVNADPDLVAGCGIVATKEGDAVHILAWNHRFPETRESFVRTETVSIPVSGDGKYLLVSARLFPGAGSAWETWNSMGRPNNISPIDYELLRAHAEPRYDAHIQQSELGLLETDLRLGSNEVIYVCVRPSKEGSAGKRNADIDSWNISMGERSM